MDKNENIVQTRGRHTLEWGKKGYEMSVIGRQERETRGPRAFYRSPDNQKQTVQSEKKENQNDRIQINACVVSNTSVCCCEHLV